MTTMYVTTNSNAETVMVEMMVGGTTAKMGTKCSMIIDRSAHTIMEEDDDNEDPPCLDLMCGIESRCRVS